MNWFKNLRIRYKLLLSFVTVITLSIALGIGAIFIVNRLNNSYTYLLDFPQKRFEYLLRIEAYSVTMRQASTAIVLNTEDPERVKTYWSQFEQAYDNAVGYIGMYLDSNDKDTVRDPAVLSQNNEIVTGIKKQLAEYRAIAEEGKNHALATGDTEETNAIFFSGATLISEINTTVDELVGKAGDYTVQIAEMDTREKDTAVVIFIAALVVITVFSNVIALYVAGLISTPIAILSGFMKKAGSTGDISLRPEDIENIAKYAEVKDEVGQCINNTRNFVQHMTNIGSQLEIIAGGNLTAEIDQLSGDDVMGRSLNSVADSLNNIFGEIQSAASQISTGSKQVADGAQSLAQGSTEQASAIEQISSSIGEIADKTQQNANVSREAANLSGTIRSSAEKGSEQMEHLMLAVREINEASNQINSVIKVIDEIAFQTNILALNAAVEAARAGQHGKGFAVVAEEVRNLAAKSAEAAKDTGGLIENSIGKANNGLNMAIETAASLKDIVDGINHSAEIVAQIAQLSDEQATAIAQINTGIEQVAQVVQQNSATAQESAAASQEMSGQSDMLEQLISRYKIKGNMLPSSASKPLAMPDYSGEYGKY